MNDSKIIVKNIFRLVCFGLIALSCITLLFGDRLFILDLFSHFQLQYFIALIIFLIFALTKKYWLEGFIILIYGIFLFAAFLQPLSFLPSQMEKPDIFFMNTWYNNKNVHDITEAISKAKPNIIALVEINRKLLTQMTVLYGKPKVYHPANDSFSCAIFSKETPISTQVILVNKYPVCRADFAKFTMLVIRPHPPFTPSYWHMQKQYFAKVRDLIDEIKMKNDFIVVGDFNSTYYSKVWRNFFNDYFNGNIYTWNTFRPLTLPLDRVLSNLRLEVRRGPQLSSDHVPLLIRETAEKLSR
ncbi:MAG: endonuclease/exonuclease/phosphatase family protein [Patescibacteria group bacterium]|nr:endonuclease/exonuclease/phosphatase family protein [Patescibacteria group bacterium]